MLGTSGMPRGVLREGLDEEELEIARYLRIEHPELEELFLANTRQARKEILHRLLQAVVREEMAGGPDRVSWREGNGEVLRIRLSDGRMLQALVKQRHSLERFDLGGNLILLGPAHSEIIEHPVRLLDLLEQESIFPAGVREEQIVRFRRELQNSAANYALALTGAELRRDELAARAGRWVAGTSLEWASRMVEEDGTFSSLAFYEQWVIDGHPFHPGAKIKLGLDTEEVIKYSPEWGASPSVAIVAVARETCKNTSLGGEGPADLLYREYPGLRAHVASVLRERGLDEKNYELIPVHPWQLDHTLPELYADAMRRDEVVPIPDFCIRTQALMSFRSLAPVQRRGQGRSHIKTAVNVQLTGAVRTISRSYAENTATVSRMLGDIQSREDRFGGRFVILGERSGAYYRPTDEDLSEEKRKTLERNLGAILRENPEDHVGPGEIPMPGSTLLARSPLGEKPVVAELIEAFAANRGISDLEEAAISFVHDYSRVALPGFLTATSRYGVSLEGHLQNSIPVFRNGRPVRMIVRDLGGVRVLRERISKQGIEADLYPGSDAEAENVHDLRSKLFYPVFQNHFGELIACIVRWLGIEERRLWQPVAGVCREVFGELKRDPAIGEQAARDEEALFQPTMDLKALTTMRLLGDVSHYTFAKVPNPMAEGA